MSELASGLDSELWQGVQPLNFTPSTNPVGITPLQKQQQPKASNQPVDPLQQRITQLDAIAEQMLKTQYGAGSLNDWRTSLQGSKATAREFYESTGRVDAGIGTGDKQIKNATGNITGYQTKDRSSGMSNSDWARTFRSTNVDRTLPGGGLVQYQGMQQQAPKLMPATNPVQQPQPAVADKPQPAGGLTTATKLADQLFT